MTETLTTEKIFPKASVLAAIDAWWAEEEAESLDLAQVDEQTVSSTKTTSVLAPLKVIDSHRAVRCLLALEPVLGRELPEKVIQGGGYDSLDELKADLVVKLEELFIKGA